MGKHADVRPVPGMKKCSKCQEVKPETREYFPKNKGTKDGFSYYCKECLSPIYKQRYKENREVFIEKAKKYQKENYRPKIRVRIRRIKKTSGRRYKVKKQVYYGRSRAGKDKSTLTVNEWKLCLEYFNNKDAYTGKPMRKPSMDHIVSLSKGGKHERSNVVLCDLNVNQSKRDKDMEEWYRKNMVDFPKVFTARRLQRIKIWMNQ